jgi:predicted lipoprotein with Yx(FWY)xxD motif
MNLSTKTRTRVLMPLCLSIALALVFSQCSDDDSVNPGQVKLQTDAALGEIIVDGNGKTLYVFTKDVNGQSQCTGACLIEWPVYYASNLEPGSGIDAADFGSITRSDGAMQSTYKGWPLYYYKGDNNPGQTTGEALGNVWFVAKPDYSIMLASTQLVGKDGKNYTSSYAEGTGETEFFTDARGRTIYRFTKDFKDKNKFTKADLSNNAAWPMFHTEIDGLPSTLNKADFGTITVFGQSQLTYKGNPLYYYGEDASPGQTLGVSVGAPGLWPVVNAQTAAAAVEPTVNVKTHATFGTILTDASGRTLYFFARDTKGTSNCTGTCPTRWPLFNPGDLVLPAGSALVATDFGTTGDGATKQFTYKGRPLYYYSSANDGTLETTGETGGENFGTVWFVAKPDYNLMVANAQLVGLDGKNYTGSYVEGTAQTRYYTDGAGRTLYLFSNDKKNTNNFTAADLSNDAAWPMFHTALTRIPAGMLASDFGTITVHGRSQLTYKGWPLYYFGADTAKGDNKGVSVPTPGIWKVITSTTPEAPL